MSGIYLHENTQFKYKHAKNLLSIPIVLGFNITFALGNS